MNSAQPKKRLLLIGGGHAHVVLLREWLRRGVHKQISNQGWRLGLVHPGPFASYSGALPATIAGWYPYEWSQVPIWSLAKRVGADLYFAKADSINPDRKELRLRNNMVLGYDVASINIGGRSSRNEHIESDGSVPLLSSRPLEIWPEQLRWLDQAWRTPSIFILLILGGGAAACELAISLLLRAKQQGWPVRIVLAWPSAELLPGHGLSAKEKMKRALLRQGVELKPGFCAQKIMAGKVLSDQGESLGFSPQAVLWAGPVRGPAFFAESGLVTSPEGFVRLDEFLRVEGSSTLFAAGDGVLFNGAKLPQAGVYAVRQGQYLAQELPLLLQGQSAHQRAYLPQKRALALMISGEKRALASYGSWSWESSLCWRLKDWIDRRFRC